MTKYSSKIVVLLLLIAQFGAKIYSQSEQENLQSLIKDYNSTCVVLSASELKYKENLEIKALETCYEKFEEIKQSLLVLNSATSIDNLKSSSAYYGILCQIKEVHIQYNFFYDADKAYTMLKEIEVFFNGTKPISSTFEYSYYGTTYTVTREFTNKMAIDFHQLMGNVCHSLKKNDETILNFNKLLELDNSKLELLPADFKKEYKRKEAKRIAEQKRANSSFNIYAGTYPFLLLKSADKRDYGAVLNFVTKKSAIEFSFLQIQQNKNFNKENYWKATIDPLKEMSMWDGYYTHAQYKQFGKAYGSTNYYQGYLLGMASKKYNAMQVDITEISTSQVTSTTFNATEKQYIAMYNFGTMFLFKGIGVDAYCGVGGSYNIFNQGAAVDKTLYTIQNASLQSNKPTSFGFVFRVGLTVGLNIGNGNLR